MSKPKCKVEYCDRECYGAKEYCRRHNMQIERYGRLTPETERNLDNKELYCSIEGCSRNVYAKKICRYHWMKLRKEIIEKEIKSGARKKIVCKSEGCLDKAIARGYCSKHYKRFMKYGDTDSIEEKILMR